MSAEHSLVPVVLTHEHSRADDEPVMASPIAIPRRPRRARRVPGNRTLRLVFPALGVLLPVYLVYLLTTSTAYSSLIDGWLVTAFELVVSALCIAAGRRRRQRRLVPMVLGAATLLWSLGDLALTIESLHGATPPTPSIADAFYLCFFPLAYVGIVLFMRGEVRRLNHPSWLDSSIAATGAAAVCAAFAFHTVLKTAGGSSLSVATNLAYPVGDLLLLGLVAGGTTILAGRSRLPWLLLAGGMAINAVGDTFNLFGSTVGATHVGVVFNNIAWPTAIFMIALAMWLPAGAPDPLALQRPPGFALPGLAAAAALMVLLVGTFRHPGPIAIGFAAATLALVGVRLTKLMRSLRALTFKRYQQAVTDSLTGLGNRRYLFEALHAWFSARSGVDDDGERLAFLFIDLDRFKEINDSFGHPAGDELLRLLGARLKGALREGDTLMRLGGDEFAGLLIDVDAEEAEAVAVRLGEALEDPFILDSVSVRIGASIGIAHAPSDAQQPDVLVACADRAMYRAKLTGETFTSYDPNIDEHGNLLRLADELAIAIAQDALVLRYQPQLDLHTGRIRAVEALLRWAHPEHGEIPPMRFIAIAEQAGLMGKLTEWVLDRAIAQCARWHEEGKDVVVSVNISPTNLLDPGFPTVVEEILERHKLPARALVLEITETCVIREFDRAKSIVERLRSSGLVVSIDDFGSGFTSLAYLSGLAVSQLKLDRAFVTRLATVRDARDLQLIRSTIELGHALDMHVVAEGIEDKETLDLLRELGCDVAQGFLIGHPALAEEAPLGANEARPAPEVKASRGTPSERGSAVAGALPPPRP
jgi:diguanylate cyclase